MFHTGTNHRFLTDVPDHIVGSRNAASFLLSKFGDNSKDKPKSLYSIGVIGFGRCHEFIHKRLVS